MGLITGKLIRIDLHAADDRVVGATVLNRPIRTGGSVNEIVKARRCLQVFARDADDTQPKQGNCSVDEVVINALPIRIV